MYVKANAVECLNLAEIDVSDEHESLTLVDGTLGSIYNGDEYPASNCNDDDLTNFCHTACDGSNDWVRFKFETSSPTLTVTVTNRVDCCDDRINGGSIEILDANMNVISTQAIDSTESSYTFVFYVGTARPSASPTMARPLTTDLDHELCFEQCDLTDRVGSMDATSDPRVLMSKSPVVESVTYVNRV